MSSPAVLQQNKWALGLLLPAAAGVLLLSGSTAPQVTIHRATGKPVTVTVEIAATPAQRERGLMFRRELPSAGGMLFIFPSESDHRFWMKNTALSLDIIFIGSNLRVVGMQTDAVPYSERRLSVGKPSRYVLEVAAGFCAREGIQVGDRVEFRGIGDGVLGGGGGRRTPVP